MQASHVGKVVVSADRSSAAPPALQQRSIPSVAITGGSGGLALMISAWLVQRGGPAYIRLLSRSGRVADASLAATAACISTATADAGSPTDTAGSLEAAGRWGPAVQAVLHAAGVLADSLLDRQSSGSFRHAACRCGDCSADCTLAGPHT